MQPFTIPHSFLLPYTSPINHCVSLGQTGNESAQSCLNFCVCLCMGDKGERAKHWDDDRVEYGREDCA